MTRLRKLLDEALARKHKNLTEKLVQVRDQETGQITQREIPDPEGRGTYDTFSAKPKEKKPVGYIKPRTTAAGLQVDPSGKMDPGEYTDAFQSGKDEYDAWAKKQAITKLVGGIKDPENKVSIDSPEGQEVAHQRALNAAKRKAARDAAKAAKLAAAQSSPMVSEGVENRVSHQRLYSVLADLSQHLEKSQQDKLAEMFVELEMLGDSMNQIPYSIFTHNDWKMLKMVYMKKVTEMQEEIEKLQKDKKDVDFHTVMKVLQFMLTC